MGWTDEPAASPLRARRPRTDGGFFFCRCLKGEIWSSCRIFSPHGGGRHCKATRQRLSDEQQNAWAAVPISAVWPIECPSVPTPPPHSFVYPAMFVPQLNLLNYLQKWIGPSWGLRQNYIRLLKSHYKFLPRTVIHIWCCSCPAHRRWCPCDPVGC